MLPAQDRFHHCGKLLAFSLVDTSSAKRGGWKNRSLEKTAFSKKE
jgi:hypothetical protein